MLPNAITLRNYRAFAGEHRIELRPLTMLYGDNNVGKSALLRVLPLLADSVAIDATGALELASESTYGSGFHDMRWKGQIDEDEDTDLGIGLEWPEPHPVRLVDYTLERREDSWRRILISRCRIEVRSTDQELRLDWVPLRVETDAAALLYDYQAAGAAARGAFGFRGLLPESFPDPVAGTMKELRQQLIGLRDRVQWLQAKRAAPARKLVKPSGPTVSMHPDGRDAVQVLYSNPDQLRAEVSGWYEEAIGRELRMVEEPPDEFRTVLRNTRRAQAFEVDMLDSGQGPIQILPVLVALALLQERRWRGPSVLAVEEPESHLHGDLQLRLADSICRAIAAADKQARVVVETHSQEMLLGVQLALLEGILAPEDVVIYWVRQSKDGVSRPERVLLDEKAYLQEAWPDPFVHAREAARKVILARKSKA
jgi:predicted ATPase